MSNDEIPYSIVSDDDPDAVRTLEQFIVQLTGRERRRCIRVVEAIQANLPRGTSGFNLLQNVVEELWSSSEPRPVRAPA